MQAISLGHAGILVRANGKTIVCDPWFVPAFFASWFVFPRNDQLSDQLMHDVCNPDFLYISHLHGDHFDERFLAEQMNKDTTVLLPGFPTREMERTFNSLGFKNFIRTTNAQEVDLGDHLTVAIHVETSITDGPGGDSALVVSDGSSRLVNQNDCRTNDLEALQSHGPVDLHFLQFSGAIWYPMVYDIDTETKKRLCDEKIESQFARALRYVERIDATHVVPSAGPPCFLDDDLFHLNRIDGSECSIFPDQTEFLERLNAIGRINGVLNIPGTTLDITSDKSLSVSHPLPDDSVKAIFRHKADYLASYKSDWQSWIDAEKATWAHRSTDLVAQLSLWWEPLLAMAPTLRKLVNGNCLIQTDGLNIYIDFAEGRVRLHDGGDYSFRFTISRDLLETVITRRAVDWSNSLFLSARFSAWRAGEYNEYLYNFFKSLSVERMNRTEAEAVRKTKSSDGVESDVEIGDFVVQRRCPHRNADLGEFGQIDGDNLVCTLHGWRFDVNTGKCLNAAEKSVRIKRRS